MSMPDLRTKLKRHLSSRYAVLRWRLERVVGCKHHAADALQETWLRLEAMVAPGPAAALRGARDVGGGHDGGRRQVRSGGCR